MSTATLTLQDLTRDQVIHGYDHLHQVSAVVVGGTREDAISFLAREGADRTKLWSQAELIERLGPQTSLREALRWAGQRRRLRLFRRVPRPVPA